MTDVLHDNAAKFEAVTKKMLQTYKEKNADYGNSFENTLDKYGEIAFIVRATDKWERIEQLTNNPAQVKDESLMDTIMDLANYCVMFKMWKDKQNTHG